MPMMPNRLRAIPIRTITNLPGTLEVNPTLGTATSQPSKVTRIPAITIAISRLSFLLFPRLSFNKQSAGCTEKNQPQHYQQEIDIGRQPARDADECDQKQNNC